jgi:2-dehydro-3-deoxyphosphogluconate aldolase/(4S)-4-hydroxy-2-oxoglutarate aldolase
VDAFEAILADRAVAVVRAPSVADPAGLAKTLVSAGIRCVEFTFTIPGVLEAIEGAASTGAFIGAGTVLRAEQARDSIAAGARFVVSPVLAPEVVGPCGDAGVPAFLAAFTPTEVVSAMRAGSTAVKLFPARVGGPQYVRDLLGPLPDARLIPSGGVDESNAREFLEAGAVAVYAGTGLLSPDLVATGDHEEIGRRAERFVASLG